jgi:acyl carrier protein
MTREEFIQELACILDEDAATMQADTPLKDVAGWNSTGALGYIAFVDGELGVEVDVDQLRKCRTVGDLAVLAGCENG